MGVHSIDAEDDQFAYRYDTQLLIDRRDRDLDEDEIADYITENFEGNSLIAAGDRIWSRFISTRMSRGKFWNTAIRLEKFMTSWLRI